MKIKIERIPQGEKTFIIAWCIYLVVKILKTSFYARYFPEHDTVLLMAVCIPLLIIHELQHMKSSYKELIGIVTCILLIFIVLRLKFMGGGGSDIALMLIFIYCSRDISLDIVFKITIVITSLMLVFIIGSCFLGIIPNYIDYGSRTRQYLGFRYTLYGPAFLFNITLLYLYIKQNKITWVGTGIVVLANILVYQWTGSRLSFGLSVIAILFAIAVKYFWNYFNRRHWWYWIVVFSFLICAVSSLILTVTYSTENAWLSYLDKIGGRRISQAHISLVRYGIHLWGQNIAWVGNGRDAYGKRSMGAYLYVDCLYIRLLQHYGPVFTGIFIILVTITMIICYRQAKYYLLFMLAFVAVHCMIDDLSWHLYYNTFWLVIGMLLMKKRKNILETHPSPV